MSNIGMVPIELILILKETVMSWINNLNHALVERVGTDTLCLAHKLAFTDESNPVPKDVDQFLGLIDKCMIDLCEIRGPDTPVFWYKPQLQVIAAALAIHPSIGPSHIKAIDVKHLWWTGTFVWTNEHEMQMLCNHTDALAVIPIQLHRETEKIIRDWSDGMYWEYFDATRLNIYLGAISRSLQRDEAKRSGDPLAELVLPRHCRLDSTHALYDLCHKEHHLWSQWDEKSGPLWEIVQEAIELAEGATNGAEIVQLNSRK